MAMSMSACTAAGTYKPTSLFYPSMPTAAFSQRFFISPNLYLVSGQSALPVVNNQITHCVSSPESATLEEEQPTGTPSDDDASLESSIRPPLIGCKACGRQDIENGCNGEGRIQGGIATVPGFGWWPIKAYRPCPAFVASGGRYRRTGQSMDEVVSGKGGRTTTNGNSSNGKSSKKKNKGP